ncbi:uncharacterized protein (DUF305 family) [Spinactinospora alkalitolerans]|uniref:Uncharacterized protein (DUF305 family) n=1 Tax=Spinactinospora alkalitolerans TaxID=687207 RepID=A0A852U167_9ACTN|nr:DUF305 domain-containing protein [Spinactinospora alkalitolerans]NYE47740.1 uncharacterized protein (DUF305 family) [Spinactinospora alkalitolerans]
MTTDTRKRALLLAPAALAAALFLASCGGGEEDSAAPAPESSEQAAAEFNDSDVMFAQMMIPHHEQAVEMSQLAEDRAGDDVKELAAEIEAAQGPEIEQLTRMLESWGEEPMSDGESMEHGMAGMMTGEEMAELEQVEGEAFDMMFLDMMVAHHEGAVEMAQNELDNGVNPEAIELAQAVVEAQQSEIEQMTGMLGDSGADGDSEGEDGGHGGH